MGGPLHPLGGGDAEQPESVGENDPGRLDEQQSCPVQVAHLLVALREHAADVVEAVEGGGGVLQVARYAVRLTQLRGGRDHARELGKRTKQLALTFVVEKRGVEGGGRGQLQS